MDAAPSKVSGQLKGWEGRQVLSSSPETQGSCSCWPEAIVQRRTSCLREALEPVTNILAPSKTPLADSVTPAVTAAGGRPCDDL
ncbi:hypothetical protein CB1_000711010 [Camelus ferus]|nr:hypothetical protein CB1_000711010 [Camelus ferus]